MIKQKTLTQNTAYYTFALVFQKVLAFAYFTFLARGLSVENLGKYTFAFSFTTIFSVFVDVGMTSVLTREIAKDKDSSQKLISNILGLKVILMFFVYAVIVVLVNLMNYPELTKNLVYLSGLVMLLDNFSTTFWGVLRGHENLKFESWGIVLFQSFIIIIGGVFLYLKLSVVYLVLVMVLASAFNFVFSFFNMRKRTNIKPRLTPHWPVIKSLLKISIPFALTGIFARLNTQVDTVFLSKMGCVDQIACDTNVGIYSVASKITLALHFIPLAFTAALFPAMSKLFHNDKEKLVNTFEKSMHYLMIIGFPIAIGVIALSPAFVPAIFGAEFKSSVLPLQILMLSLATVFLTFPIGSLLNASSRQLRNSMHIGVAVLINIILNLILIPKITFTGAAISSLASSVVILILGLWVAPQIINYNKKSLLINFFKILLSAVVMGTIIYWLLDKVHFVILIPLGAVIYFIMLFLFKGFSKDDVNNILVSMKIKRG